MIMAIKEGAGLSLLLVVAVPVMAVVIGVMLIMVVPLFRSMQVKIDRINQVLREQITGRAGDPRVRPRPGRGRRFGGANADLTATALRVNRIFALVVPALMLILNLSSVAVLWFGGRLVERGLDADRQPHRVPDLHPADPDVGDDGGDDGDPGAARGGQRGAGPAGAGHRAVGRRPAAPGPRRPA